MSVPCTGYLAHGTATDYLYEKLGVPLSFTWEIYGDAAAHFNDCFRMFNPTDLQRFEEVRSACKATLYAYVQGAGCAVLEWQHVQGCEQEICCGSHHSKGMGEDCFADHQTS